MLASTLSRPRCGIANGDLVQPLVGRALQDAVEQRDERLAALEREALLPDVLGLQEGLERLAGVEPLEHVQLLRRSGACAFFSTRSCSQRRSAGSWMCMYSMPTVRQ
jgi:hypothetical protein